MRVIFFIFMVLSLTHCSGHTDSVDQTALLKQEVMQVLNQKLEEKEYTFQLKVVSQKPQQPQLFIGKQNGAEWEIQNKQNPEQKLIRKQDHILAVMGEHQEKLGIGEVGLVSPSDHFMFIKELKGEFQSLEPITWNQQKAKRAKIQLDQSELSEKLKRRLFYDNNPIAIALEELTVDYTLTYLPDTLQLVQCTLNINDGKNQQQLVMDFTS